MESDFELDYEEPDFQSLRPDAQSTLKGSQNSQKSNTSQRSSSSKTTTPTKPDKKQETTKKSSITRSATKSLPKANKIPLQPISQKFIPNQREPVLSDIDECEPQLSDVSSLDESPPDPRDVNNLEVANNKPEDEQGEVEEQEFEVEKVLGCRTNEENGEIEYLLAWKNWNGPPTWEPKAQCDCEDLIVAFHKIQDKPATTRGRPRKNNIQSPPRKKIAHGPISQKRIPTPEPTKATTKSPECITLSSSSEDDDEDDNIDPKTCEDVKVNVTRQTNLEDDSDDSQMSLDVQTPLNKKEPSHVTKEPKELKKNLTAQSFNVKPKPKPDPTVDSIPPPPPNVEKRHNNEQGYKALLERRLNLDRIVGTTDHPEKYVIVKWQNITHYEKVPIDIFRQFWPQELLDFFIKHIEFV